MLAPREEEDPKNPALAPPKEPQVISGAHFTVAKDEFRKSKLLLAREGRKTSYHVVVVVAAAAVAVAAVGMTVGERGKDYSIRLPALPPDH